MSMNFSKKWLQMVFAALCGMSSVCTADNNTGFIPGDLETAAQTKKVQQEKKKYVLSERLKKPYISTYYIKPIISPEEDAVIRFYVTDWYQSLYRCNDDSKSFKVAISCTNGNKKDRTKITKQLENLQEGDHEINLGKLPTGVYTLTLQCKDNNGRLSHVLYQEFWVQSDKMREIPQDKIYHMTESDMKRYGIRNDGDLGKLFLVDTSDIDAKDEKRLEKIKARLEEAAAKAGKPKKGHYYIFAHSSKPGMTDFRNYQNCKIVYASDYNKDMVEKQARMTASGLQKLMDDKAKEGFRKIVFQKGTYRISSEFTLRPPSWMTIDLNGASIKLNSFTGCKGLMMDLCNTVDSHVINGTIEGDYFEHDYANSPNSSEWVCGISISGHATYSSFENIHLKYITGYGSTNGISNSDGKGFTFTPSLDLSGFQLGDINRETGALVRVHDACTSKMIPLDKLKGHDFSVSKYLGYQGRVSDSWYVTVHFYNANKQYIGSTEAYQYRFLRMPGLAAYACVTVSGNDPEELNKAGLKLNTFRIPWNCAFKKIIHENCRAVGMAQSAMRNFLVEDCEFFRCGENLAKCAYDAEDGWDQMQDIYIHNNYFHDNFINDFLTCAGHNFIIEGNRGDIHLWDRTNSSCVRNNTGKTGTFYVNGHSRTQFLRLENNHFTDKISLGRGGDEKKPSDWYTVLRGDIDAAYVDTGHNARLFNATVKDKKLGTVTAQDSTLENCSVNFSNSMFHNCTLTNVSGQINANAVFSQCKMNCVSGSIFLPIRLNILDCDLTDSSFTLNYWSKPCEIYVENSTVKNEKLPLIKTPAYSIKNFILTGLKSDTGSEPLIWIYDLRAQSTDNEPGSIAVVKSDITNTANKIIYSGEKRKSEKKITLSFKDNHTPDTMKPVDLTTAQEAWDIKTE